MTDACSSGSYPDVDQVEVSESSQPCILSDGNVEGVAQLDGAVYALANAISGYCIVQRAFAKEDWSSQLSIKSTVSASSMG